MRSTGWTMPRPSALLGSDSDSTSATLVPDLAQQQPGHQPPLVLGALTDGRQAGFGHARQLDVVEPDDRHVIGDALAELADHADGTERHEVGRDEDAVDVR